MGLLYNDLKDCVIKELSFDQYEPKTGSIKDTIVMAFQTPIQGVGADLVSYLNNGNKKIKDADVSPNKNESNYYMVFVEFARNPDAVEVINQIISEVENLTGKLQWEGISHIHDEAFPVNEDIANYIATDPESYQTRDEYEEAQMTASVEEKNTGIMEFLKASTLDNVEIAENVITMSKGSNTAQLDIVGFGNKDIMKDIGISESALEPVDAIMRSFNGMLGTMRAVKIAEHVVIFHPEQHTVLVTRKCSA